MAVSTIGVADAATPDKYLHTHQRTISATAREDQYVQQGESAYPTYSAVASNISIATANDHILQVMADGTNYTRLKRIRISPTDDVPAAAAIGTFRLYRLTTAGSGGSAVTAQPYDTADTYGGAAMTLPSSKGTEGTMLAQFRLAFPSTIADMAQQVVWEELPGMKPIVCGTASSAGLVLKNMTAIASCTVDVTFEFITTSYL